MLSDEAMKEYEAFKYYYQTNTEKGISYIPDYMCENVLNLIEKQSKEIEHWKAGMKIVEKDKNNHIERLEKEIELINQTLGLEKDSDINKTLEKIIILNNYEDKIKAKIEEAKKKYNDLHTKHLRDCGIAEQRELAKIEFGQSLLEKE